MTQAEARLQDTLGCIDGARCVGEGGWCAQGMHSAPRWRLDSEFLTNVWERVDGAPKVCSRHIDGAETVRFLQM